MSFCYFLPHSKPFFLDLQLLTVSTPLHYSPKFYLNCYLLTLMTKSNKTPIQQALMHPLDLKYAHGPLNLSEVKQHVDKCRVRTKAEHKVLLLDTAIQSYVVLLYSWWRNLIGCFSTGTSVCTPLTLLLQAKPQCSLCANDPFTTNNFITLAKTSQSPNHFYLSNHL